MWSVSGCTFSRPAGYAATGLFDFPLPQAPLPGAAGRAATRPPSLMRYLIQLLAGLIFGLGLALADMTSPRRVLAFLDVAGDWDPSLLFVLGGAVCTTFIGYRLVLRRPRPRLDSVFHLSTLRRIDRPLVLGSVLFGLGWGIGGFCPGPGVALLAVPGNPETWIFLAGLAVGIVLYRFRPGRGAG